MDDYCYTSSDDDTWEEIDIDAASDGSWEDVDALLDVAGNIDGEDEEGVDKKHDAIVKANDAAVKSSEKKSSDDPSPMVDTLISVPKCDAGIDETEGCSHMRRKCKHESCSHGGVCYKGLEELEICARYYEELFIYTERGRERLHPCTEKGTAEEIGGFRADKLTAVTMRNFEYLVRE